MTINEQESQFANHTIKFDEKNGTGEAPGGVLVSAKRLDDPPNTYQIKIDGDGDGDLLNERSVLLSPNSSIIVRVKRSAAGRSLPYTLEYSREMDQTNQIRERLSWSPHYRAEGKIRVGNCQALFVALDLNGDGKFDERDFLQGTSIGLDRNGDGRIWGSDEWLTGNQIIEYCGKTFLIDGLDVEGARISLTETSLWVPKIGERLPQFLLTTVEGNKIDLQALKEKIYLLDFWASWCKPCIEKFVLVKQLGASYGDALAILPINVDEESRLAMAREVIKDYDLKWPQVMMGRGEADPLWKTFGSMQNNRMAIPLYVLIDPKGILRYAGNGEENLLKVRQAIEDIQKAR